MIELAILIRVGRGEGFGELRIVSFAAQHVIAIIVVDFEHAATILNWLASAA